VENMPAAQFVQRIFGQSVDNVHRRGKFLVFTLSADTLLMHLRMSGDLRVEAAYDGGRQALPPHKHDRIILLFESGQRMVFNNPRKFGRVWLTDRPEDVLDALGPEPLDPALTEEKFCAMLQSHQRMVKPLLMDQHFLAGMGNIYTDEALFRAGLHPRAISSTLTAEQCALLLRELTGSIAAAIFRMISKSTGAQAKPARAAGKRSNACWSDSAVRISAQGASVWGESAPGYRTCGGWE